MIIPSEDEIILINKKLGHSVANVGNIKFLISRLKSLRLVEDERRNMAKAAASVWFNIISLHPFSDGNKRTAAEAMKYFLALNNYRLDMPPNGIVYMSLKVANGDITLNGLVDIVYNKLAKVE